jgi:tetratricopeptide (TPR) repeat protein
MDDYFDLGSHSRPVTTTSAEAQRWFDRGLVWSYAFNHEEAVRCFERAAAADPWCAMAYWGIAYALGPNYNKAWDAFDEAELVDTILRTHDAVDRARAVMGDTTTVEQALIGALAARYPGPDAPTDHSVWNADYADAMARVHEGAPDDLDVAALYADALMNLTPWQLWDLVTGEPAPGARTVEARRVLDLALLTDAALVHPGILHMYIHLMEMSPEPERAQPVSDRLRGLVPDAGHLQHMPSHLDVICGDYRAAIRANTAAITADEKYRSHAGAMNFYTLYRCHDYHFAIYAAMLVGQQRVALEAVAGLEATIPADLLQVQSPPMADWLEGFLAMRVHVLIRFGRWAEIIALPAPPDADLYCVNVAMRHYARGVACSATGRVAAAEVEREAFQVAVQRVPDTRMIFNNTCRDILAVASAMLDGELEYRKGNHDVAFALLEHAVELDDHLPYDEPWAWMQPARHALGALLLEQGRVEAAEAVYRADLGLDSTLPRQCQHPNNVWSLVGLHESLVALGKSGEAEIIGVQAKFAAALADIPVTASCFCRGAASPAGSSSDGCGCGEGCTCAHGDHSPSMASTTQGVVIPEGGPQRG